jgi:hypothetical protein
MQPQPSTRQLRDMQMAGMGRVERTAKQADADASAVAKTPRPGLRAARCFYGAAGCA